jgi:protein-S-isoprenylcysteine O-methyltransferase Ste14
MVAIVDASRRLIGGAVGRERETTMPASKNLLFTLVLPAFLVLVVPYFLVGGRLDFLGSVANSWVRMFGFVPFAIGAGLIVTGAVAGLIVTGAVADLTTSSDAKTSVGPYRISRNPIMLGVVVAVAAQYLLYDWAPILAYLVVLFVSWDCLARFTIEPRMIERHGEAYRAYLETVPRWLPRIASV